MNMAYKVFAGVVLGLAIAGMAPAQSALNLAKRGNDYVGIQSKGKVLRIYSDKSTGGIEPSVWHVVYYDPDRFSKSIQVIFAGGQEQQVAPAVHIFHMPAKGRDVLDQSKVVVDSDRALDIAQTLPSLQGLTLTSSVLTLEIADAGPVWTVQLWAAKKKDTTKEAKLGTVTISATDSSIIKSDLKPENVN
jgi:hypothetical protein